MVPMETEDCIPVIDPRHVWWDVCYRLLWEHPMERDARDVRNAPNVNLSKATRLLR